MRSGLFVLLSLLSLSLHAAPMYPGASMFESSRLTDTRFTLAVGGMEKQDGVWQPEKTLKVSVDGHRDTHEIGYEASTQEVFEYYSNAFKPVVVKQLFSCEALDCGSSAQWANGYFGVRELYGPDRGQRLNVWLVEEGGQQQVVTLYVIQRGNRKVYAHIDQFDLLSPMRVEAPRAQIVATVFDVEAMRSDEMRDLARQIRLEQQQGVDIWLVGHAYGSADQAVNEETGESLASALGEKLSLLGLQDLQMASLGMLAPVGEVSVDRVVVLAVRRD